MKQAPLSFDVRKFATTTSHLEDSADGVAVETGLGDGVISSRLTR